jgi:hypothetical protein
MSAPCLTTTDGPHTAAREAGQAGPAGWLAGLPAGGSAPAWLVPVDCSAGPAAGCIGCPAGVVLPFLAALCCRKRLIWNGHVFAAVAPLLRCFPC